MKGLENIKQWLEANGYEMVKSIGDEPYYRCIHHNEDGTTSIVWDEPASDLAYDINSAMTVAFDIICEDKGVDITMHNLFLFNKLGISLSLNSLLDAAGITHADNGEGYALKEPIIVFNDRFESFKVVDFCLERESKIGGFLMIGIENGGKVKEHYADWVVTSDDVMKATKLF